MPSHVQFRTLIEDRPGEQWRALFDRFWPGYRAWFLRGAPGAGYLDSRRALRKHMPELVPTWEALVELAGGGDTEARFLSSWCPPPYIRGCAQAVWLDAAGSDEPALLRNYDYAPGLLEGNWLATRWCGQRVVALGDCMWGALDGLNESGLAASLSFGGRTEHGEGFGVPIALRYLLETAETTAQAVQLLQRLPISMSYSITLLDRRSEWATVFVAPDRAAEVTKHLAVTNFQHRVEWPAHANSTRATLRLERLREVAGGAVSAELIAEALLQPPLFQTGYERGWGTLYTALYRPTSGRVELRWPQHRWQQSIAQFAPGTHSAHYADEASESAT